MNESLKTLSSERAALNLAVIRFLYFLLVFYLLSPGDYFLAWGHVPAAFWAPMGLLAFFEAPPVSTDVHAAIYFFWALTIPLCGLGIFYRKIAPLNFAAGFFITNYASSFGVHTHTYIPVILAGLPLAFSYASDKFSLDRAFFRRPIATDARVYASPIRTIQIVFCLVFFISAIAKLRFGGTDWVTSDTLRNYLFRASQIFPDADSFVRDLRLGSYLYQHEALTHWFAAFTIVFEFVVPLAYFYRPSAKIIVPALLVMQIGFFFAMYVNFASFLALYVVWVDWPWVADRLRPLTKPFDLKEKASVVAS